MSVVVGAPIWDKEEKLKIASLAILADGSVVVYTKQYLHPGEEQVFTAGRGGPTFRIEDHTIALAICADTLHREHPADASARGAGIYVASVLITEKGYRPDTMLLQRWAREYGLAVLMANHSGPTGEWVPAGRSALWSEEGNLIVACPGTEETLIFGNKVGGEWQGKIARVF